MKQKPEKMKQVIEDYLTMCRRENRIATSCGLAVALDVSEKTLEHLREQGAYREILGCFDAACEDMAVNSERKNAALYLKARCRYTEKGEGETEAAAPDSAVQRIPLSEKKRLLREILAE